MAANLKFCDNTYFHVAFLPIYLHLIVMTLATEVNQYLKFISASFIDLNIPSQSTEYICFDFW